MQILINLFGHSTAGKTTIAQLLQGHINDLYTVDFDIIKRQLARYDWTKHTQVGRKLTLGMLEVATRENLPILLLMPSSKNNEEYELIRSIATQNNYRIVNIELTAPSDVLIERYVYRLEHPNMAEKGWKFKTLDEFKGAIKVPYFRPDDTLTFNSSIESPDQIAEKIIKNLP